MPKFLDAPSWYSSKGSLTSDASITSGILQVRYQNSATKEYALIYIPVPYSESDFNGFSTPLSLFSIMAMVSQKPFYSCCSGQVVDKNNSVGVAAWVQFNIDGSMDINAVYLSFLGEFHINFALDVDSKLFNVQYQPGLNGYATLK